MKTMTCEEMGGTCAATMTANTPEEMVSLGMVHLKEAHLEMVEQVAAMSDEEKANWMAEFQQKWDAKSEDEAAPADEAGEEEEAPAAE